MNKRLRKQISIKDVAEKAGVAPSTVSRILSKSPILRAKQETIDRVNRIAAEMNYRPDISARSLRTRQTFALTMYVPSVASPVFPEIIQGAEDACNEYGYSLFIGHLDEKSVEKRRYLDMINEGRVDGLLMATTLVEESVIEDLVDSRCSFFLINRRSTATRNYVAIDDTEGARMAVNHLVELGHEKIGFISGPLRFDTSLRRFQGFRQGLHENGLDYHSAITVETDWLSYTAGSESMKRILAEKKRPTAVFVSNLMSCVGAMSAVQNAGLRIPQDMSIIGFHDAPLAEVLVPAITVVKMPLYDMGHRGTVNLIRLIRGEPVDEPELLSPIDIIRRNSTAPPGGYPGDTAPA